VLSVTYTLLEAWVKGAAPSDLRNPAMVESRVRGEL
jgi:hypothetical protein